MWKNQSLMDLSTGQWREASSSTWQRGGSRVNGRRCFCFSLGKKSRNNVWKGDFSVISYIFFKCKVIILYRTWTLLGYLSHISTSWSLFDAPFGNSWSCRDCKAEEGNFEGTSWESKVMAPDWFYAFHFNSDLYEIRCIF